jgi:hypothetical protein
MSSGGKAVWEEILQSQRTPFDLVNADGDNFAWLQKTHVESVYKDVLEALQKKILNTKVAGNLWVVIEGSYGAGKTHLLQMLHRWAHDNKVFFWWIDTYYGKHSLDLYLTRNLLDAMLHTRGFASPDNNAPPPNMLQEIAFPLVKRTLENLLKSGDQGWPQELCTTSFLGTILFNKEAQKKRLLACLGSASQLPQILQEVNGEKLAKCVRAEYKDMTAGISDVVVLLLQLAFAFDDDSQHQAFQRLLGEKEPVNQEDAGAEEDEQETEKQASHRSNLATGLCFLLSQGEVPVCMALDQFETMYNHLRKSCLDGKDAAETKTGQDKLRAIINDIFGGLGKFFNNSQNISLVFSCQIDMWKELSDFLEYPIKRRIEQPAYTLRTPTVDEIMQILQKRLQLFWQEMKMPMADRFFPFDPAQLTTIIQNCRRRFGPILSELRPLFLQEMGRLAESDKTAQSQNFVDCRNRLQSLQRELGTGLLQRREVFTAIGPLASQPPEYQEWLRDYVKSFYELLHQETSACESYYQILLGHLPADGLSASALKLTELEKKLAASASQLETMAEEQQKYRQQLAQHRQEMDNGTSPTNFAGAKNCNGKVSGRLWRVAATQLVRGSYRWKKTTVK